MACFIVPAAEAVVMTVVTGLVKGGEKKRAERAPGELGGEEKTPFSRKLKWLTNMLWGGSALLAFEHVWRGELAPWSPFLTAAGGPAGALREMATVGVGMALCVTAVWGVAVLVSNAVEKRALKEPDASASEN